MNPGIPNAKTRRRASVSFQLDGIQVFPEKQRRHSTAAPSFTSAAAKQHRRSHSVNENQIRGRVIGVSPTIPVVDPTSPLVRRTARSLTVAGFTDKELRRLFHLSQKELREMRRPDPSDAGRINVGVAAPSLNALFTDHGTFMLSNPREKRPDRAKSAPSRRQQAQPPSPVQHPSRGLRRFRLDEPGPIDRIEAIVVPILGLY
ncbi:hypothetical protein J8273_0252 [Carpediemonas membranifera]|uniref:Uncharacterized protein n=1 Tax=Carpediemonas membranifera TaxID=201153 RepID=A0A8J6AZ94_9EUKA|nr:hypothetical protein J8273_0252 [Carpediemonas membranifera]|eukprot:KAG9395040.1 hypothetical protein J8273_0252 [Carpediemonas membranifera]